jgi:alpha-tubulin suppressor-like RCC1 family protein
VLVLPLVASCLSDQPLAPTLRPERHIALAVTCRIQQGATVATSCATSAVGTGASRAAAAGKVRAALAAQAPSDRGKQLVIGGQDLYLSLEPVTSSYAAGTFTVGMRIRNLLTQPLGTANGATATSSGNAVLFPGGVGALVVQGSGTVQLANADSIGTGVQSGTPFINYPGVIPAAATSAVRQWAFTMPATVQAAEFTSLVFTTVVDSSVGGFAQPSGFIAAGSGPSSFRCAIRTGGTVYCWVPQLSAGYGLLGNGQLGYTVDGIPKPVPGTGYTQVAMGSTHACAIRGAQVVCWGNHAEPFVGAGPRTALDTTDLSPVVVPLPNGGVPVAVATNAVASCALSSAGELSCWGYGGFVGDGTAVDRFRPVVVQTGVSRVASGGAMTCTLDTSVPAVLRCWGSDRFGAGVGDGTPFARTAPVVVAAPPGRPFTSISVGPSASCAVDVQQTAWCWGNNHGGGYLGTMDSVSSNVLAPDSLRNPAGTRFSQVFAGLESSCAIDASVVVGSVLCWGNNQYGQLGTGNFVPSRHPVRVATGPYVSVAVNVGSSTCAVRSSGELDCWGTNYNGELGIAAPINGFALTPTQAVAGAGTVQVASAGQNATCLLGSSGVIRCMGFGANGQLGDGGAGNLSTQVPQGVLGLPPNVAEVAVGDAFGCARGSAGQVACWGTNTVGELGQGDSTTRALPAPVNVGASGAHALAAGMNHACALRAADSTTVCWGTNASGQAGQGGSVQLVRTPFPVGGIPKAWAIAAGDEGTCILAAADSTAWCWGFTRGQVNTVPTAVPGSAGARGITMGAVHLCIIPRSGLGVLCAGVNDKGQLGDGTFTDRANLSVVTQMAGEVISIAAYFSTTCAVTGPTNTTEGANLLYCWGENDANGSAALGGTAFNTSGPNLVAGGDIIFTKVWGASRAGGCALELNGDLWCWGPTPGDGSAVKPYPVRIAP